MLQRRNQSLDGIRGIAIALVIVHHAFQFTVPGTQIHLGAAIEYLASSAWIGVDLFFVLSGYLITGILLNTRDRPGFFRTFYMRRVFRIFPLYYLFLAVLAIAALFSAVLRANINLGWNMLYLANVRVAVHEWPWRPIAHLWSLSVEEQFYVVWPALIFIMPRRRTLESILVVIGLFLMIRHFSGFLGLDYLAVFVLLHADGLIIGAALAAMLLQHPATELTRRAAWVVLLLSSAILLAETIHGRGLTWQNWKQLGYLNYTLIAVWGASLIAVSVSSSEHSWINRILSMRPLVVLGKYSYAIYILHIPLDSAFRASGLHPESALTTVPYAAFLTLVALGGALITWHLIEQPCIRLKDRLYAYQ